MVLPKISDSNKRLRSLTKFWRKPLVEPPKLTKMQLLLALLAILHARWAPCTKKYT